LNVGELDKLSWNLCARSDTCAGIHSSHIDWENDCLLVSINKTKRNYQEDGIQFHVFGNMLEPDKCPVLSLALRCASNPSILSGEKRLFHDTKSENCGFGMA
jgi:hypothetical protein